MKTEVYTRLPVEFNMVGQVISRPIRALDQSISEGLANRLYRYALGVLSDTGFSQAVQGWNVEVYTIHGDSPPRDRAYCVRWLNASGGYIEVVGILTRKGWPSLDHGLCIGTL